MAKEPKPCGRCDRKLCLSQADVESVIHYIFQHVRTSPTGRGHRVWERMLEFQNGKNESQRIPGGKVAERK